jgi:hypothetical protein
MIVFFHSPISTPVIREVFIEGADRSGGRNICRRGEIFRVGETSDDSWRAELPRATQERRNRCWILQRIHRGGGATVQLAGGHSRRADEDPSGRSALVFIGVIVFLRNLNRLLNQGLFLIFPHW